MEKRGTYKNEGKERVNLEGIFYDEEGNFTPLTANHGNIDGDLAHLRNTYMESERENFESLLANEKIRKEFATYLQYDSSSLYKFAIKFQEKLESGMLEDEQGLKRMKFMTP